MIAMINVIFKYIVGIQVSCSLKFGDEVHCFQHIADGKDAINARTGTLNWF